MKRDVWLVLILGCILILVLEAPAALSSVTAGEPYDPWEAPPEASPRASIDASTETSVSPKPAADPAADPAAGSRQE